MSAKKKHSTADQYLNYLKGELSGKERHDFERNLEADPFEMEAMEGLEMLSPEQANEDILSLHSRLRKRLARRRRVTFYSVAASVASLLIIGTVFLQIYDFNPAAQDEMSEQEIPMMSKEKKEASRDVGGIVREKAVEDKPVEESESAMAKTSKQSNPAPQVVLEKKGAPMEQGPGEKPVQQVLPSPEPEVLDIIISEQAEASEELFFADEEIMEDAKMEPEADDVGMIQVEAEPRADQLTAAPARSAETKRSSNAMPVAYPEEAVSDSVLIPSSTEPSIGYESFMEYIEDNIKYPDSEIGSSREVVILTFTVTAAGEFIDFVPVKSPGEKFTEEAIRLVKEGPSWNPATNPLGAIDEVVRLRFVFRK